MIQDIWPKQLDSQYRNIWAQDDDTVFYFQASSLLAKPVNESVEPTEENALIYPRYDEFIRGINASYGEQAVDKFEFIYLLSVDNEHFFLAKYKGNPEQGVYLGELADSEVHNEMHSFVEGYEFIGVNSFRKAMPREHAFAAITASLSPVVGDNVSHSAIPLNCQGVFTDSTFIFFESSLSAPNDSVVSGTYK